MPSKFQDGLSFTQDMDVIYDVAVDLAKSMLEKYPEKIVLPCDSLITDKLDFGGKTLGDTSVATGDIPLAARCIEGGAAVLKFNGEELNARNIGPILATRDLMSDIRAANPFHMGGGKGFTKQDRSRFLERLEHLVRKASK